MSKFSDYCKFLIDINNRSIKSFIHDDLFGIYGSCQAQDPIFLKKAIETELGNYSTQEASYIIGQKTVDVVLSVLNSIPDIYVFQTPPNSAADVGMRWDLIMNYKGLFFPIQVKSSLQQILKLTYCHEIEDEDEAIREMSETLEDNREGVNKYVDKQNKEIFKKQVKIGQRIFLLSSPSGSPFKTNHLSISACDDEDCKFYENKESIAKLNLKNKILEDIIESECWEKTHPLYIWIDTADSTLEKTMEVMRQILMQFIHPTDCRFTQVRQLEDSAKIPQKLYQEKVKQQQQEELRKACVNTSISQQVNPEKIILITSLLEYQIYCREQSIDKSKGEKKPVLISQANSLKEVIEVLSICQEIIKSKIYQEYFLIETEQKQKIIKKLSKLIEIDKENNAEILKITQSIQALVRALISYSCESIERFILQEESLENFFLGEEECVELYLDF